MMEAERVSRKAKELVVRQASLMLALLLSPHAEEFIVVLSCFCLPVAMMLYQYIYIYQYISTLWCHSTH